MQIADRLTKIPPYLFMELRKKIGAARAAGVDVISLAIGDPVEATPQTVIDELCRTAYDPANHRYPTDEEKGMLAFRQEVARWYGARYGVTLDPATEILGLIGSKEGCHHFILARINPGDIVLMTDPGYPAYRASILMGGGEPWNVPILAHNDYLPVLADIPTDIARKARGMFLNYPNNPTGACATKKFLNDLVAFAKQYDIAVCYDNPYSEILFAGQERISFLMAPGAKDVGVELNSLSKPFNMCGWRLGMACGNPDLIAAISKVKENTDSGIFNPIQFAGIHALKNEAAFIDHMTAVYGRRRELVLTTLKKIGISFTPPRGTFYLWVPVPEGMTSLEFTNRLFDKTAIVVAAGTAYGKYGEGYVRISLTVPDDRLAEAMARIEKEFAP
ncbi:MAG TPA: LL-diaminopimelate aminotransferase [Syntrophales bacterium]|nr:LL-diaminopimelate aminotransferase [Syntrophales bacterium]HON22928.1 LL-diaminopimelate aminotransferase [Syntrophales bacterium]HOU77500.1 LL-diaminopimelate aminotransferase [Syntrophales bacterium]HPC31924.1 LL-diaminopimelate aminotransferase [Syntrophales bacterium]HQG35379.1 LL-diaminopimelate aminotransferase [Syntrophales bacterium]